MLEVFNAAGAELLKQEIEAVAVGTAKPKMVSKVEKQVGNDTKDVAEYVDKLGLMKDEDTQVFDRDIFKT